MAIGTPNIAGIIEVIDPLSTANVIKMLDQNIHQKLVLEILIQIQVPLISSLLDYKYVTTLSKLGLVRSNGGLTFSPM